MVEVIPTAAPVGAEIRGVDIASGVGEAGFTAIRSALHERGVAFMRGQRLGAQEQVNFARRLGPLVCLPAAEQVLAGHPELSRISNIIENGRPIGFMEAGQYWHSDQSYTDRPSAYSVLHALEVPHAEDGRALGATLFAGAAYAYETLPEATRRRIANLQVIHFRHNPFTCFENSDLRKELYVADFADVPRVVHPLVRSHPHTGRPCLFVNERYTMGVVGLDEQDGRALIDELVGHITRPEAVYRHEWREGDVVIWDDCMVQHHAVADYALPARRLLVKAMVEGTSTFAETRGHHGNRRQI